MNKEEVKSDERYLNLLADKFPTIAEAATEIINLEAILNLPKGTEHLLSDLHGENSAFQHVLNNASGVIRRKVDDIFGMNLREADKNELCSLIYYPEEKLKLINETEADLNDWYRITLHRVVEIAREVSSKYTRSKVRRFLPKDFAYIIEELLHEQPSEPNKQEYYAGIIRSIIETRRSEEFIKAICQLIHHLVIDSLHIIGDVYDRGPGACAIMDTLCNYHDFDIQWGNHDISWMGAAAGNLALIANVVRISIRYMNVETLEEGYSINLLPLATFAIDTYGDDPCEHFQVREFENNSRMEQSMQMMAKMHKAISIIQFKLEGQIIKRHPEYVMEDRRLLHLIDYERGVITIAGKEYPLVDTKFPTVDPAHPYSLSNEERKLMEQLFHSFTCSERLQKHLRCLYQHGSLFLKRNNNLLYHAAIPLNDDGTFRRVKIDDEEYSGRQLLERIDRIIRDAYFADAGSETRQRALDYMWYLWCGPDSPLYNKDKMTTFERYFTKDEELFKEKKGAYYELCNNEETCDYILQEFGLDPANSRIVNGHIPVRTTRGESPLRANGKRLVIDGGFSKPYHKTTGIAGYTLIYNSHGLHLVQHEAFESKEKAVAEGSDIHSRTQLVDFKTRRMLVRDTDRGKELAEQVANLQKLLFAYRNGIIKER
ncbi:MAG: fructose-1,6-bisphosphatase [Marinilabiliaceae bacterium]|nr:fructose-1,6-bisphosphatase [Marinilabiliaceae bacterium]